MRFLFLLSLAACGGGTTRTEDILALTGDATTGATVYGSSCAACHAADGTGGTGSDLTAAIPGLTDAEIVDTIILGSGDMAPVNLPDQDVADVLAHLTATF
jgi:mono/diheme cytochrome c family protein